MLKERQLNILTLIIKNYNATGQPIGSKTLMELGIHASSATIRNDMSALEKVGFLEKAHTSSGRVPTLNGLRFYIDNVLAPMNISANMLNLAPNNVHELDSYLEQFVQSMAKATNYTTFAIAPNLEERLLTDVQILPLNHLQRLVLLITDNGQVETHILSMNSLSEKEVETFHLLVQNYFVGEKWGKIKSLIKTRMPMILHQYFDYPQEIIHLLEELFPEDDLPKVHISGKLNLLEYFQIKTSDDFRELYRFFGHSKAIADLFQTTKDFDIRIGTELNNQLFNGMSLLTTDYLVENHGVGKLAVLGPLNMDYEKNIHLLKSAGKELADRLNEYYRYLSI